MTIREYIERRATAARVVTAIWVLVVLVLALLVFPNVVAMFGHRQDAGRAGSHTCAVLCDWSLDELSTMQRQPQQSDVGSYIHACKCLRQMPPLRRKYRREGIASNLR